MDPTNNRCTAATWSSSGGRLAKLITRRAIATALEVSNLSPSHPSRRAIHIMMTEIEAPFPELRLRYQNNLGRLRCYGKPVNKPIWALCQK